MEDKKKNVNIRLCEAIQNGDLIEVSKALKDGAKPHARIDYDTYLTPWRWAYFCKNSSILSYLLREGKANVNARLADVFHQTIIFGAVLNRKMDIIRYLVSQGADLNIMDEDGYTPLYMTLGYSEEWLSQVPLILELGANIKIGIDKLDEIKEDEPASYKDFCNQIVAFLEEADRKGDFEVLQTQLPRLMEISNHLPDYLSEKVKFLEPIYCFNYDDDEEDDDKMEVLFQE